MRIVVALLVWLVSSNAVFAQQREPIRYVLRIPAPKTHYIDVEASYPAAGKNALDLTMAVWTPGSYLVREFARNVETVAARTPSGASLAVEKTRKNRWRVQTRGAARVVVTYRVYGHERAGRLNWIEEDFALINGAPTFITLLETGHRPHEVTLDIPANWARSLTSLPATTAGGAHRYRAADFDELVDSPIIAGNPSVHEFTVDGKVHALVNVGDTTSWDGPRSARDVEKIVRGARALWGFLPYDRYIFFNFLADTYDGIEHKSSTVLFSDRNSTRADGSYHSFLGLAAHEFFHAWNVKRLRPVALGPFDYENENYTRSLWIAEGLTDYYSWMLVGRTGLGPLATSLTDVSDAIRSLQTTPGRLVQPLELASFDAWIKQYRPDENSANTSINYYTKGSVVGVLLDATIRRMTKGAKNLDDVMRLAYTRYSGARGYSPAQFEAVASEVAGGSLRSFFHRALETTEELDYTDMLDWYGLQFTTPVPAEARLWLGAGTRGSAGRIFVTSILRGSPAYGSGLNVGDEILAINDVRPDSTGLDGLLRRHQPGNTVTVQTTRQGEQHRATVTLATLPMNAWKLAVRADATAEQQARLNAWIGPR